MTTVAHACYLCLGTHVRNGVRTAVIVAQAQPLGGSYGLGAVISPPGGPLSLYLGMSQAFMEVLAVPLGL